MMRKFGVVELHIRSGKVARRMETIKLHKLSGTAYEFGCARNGYLGIEGRITIFDDKESADDYFENLVSLTNQRGSFSVYQYRVKGLTARQIAKRIADSYIRSSIEEVEVTRFHGAANNEAACTRAVDS